MAKPRLLGMAASVLAAGVALSGCSGQPGAAAIIEGQTISEQELSRSGQALQPFLSSPLSPRSMLSSMIQADVFLPVASEHGLAASADEARDYLDSIAEQAKIDAPETYPDGTVEVTRMLMISQQLRTSGKAQEVNGEVADRMAELDVSISPRYGDWDPEGTTGSLIKKTTPEWVITPDDGSGSGSGSTGSGSSDSGGSDSAG